MPDPHLAHSWSVADDVEEVHQLLCESDAAQALARAPVPVRRIETTRRLIAERSIQILRREDRAIAMITLAWRSPFPMDLWRFPPARNPAYMSRLAARPSALAEEPLLGLQCVRRAVELARTGGADAVRCEANPDLARVTAMLGLLGFVQCGAPLTDGGRRRVHLQKSLSDQSA